MIDLFDWISNSWIRWPLTVALILVFLAWCFKVWG